MFFKVFPNDPLGFIGDDSNVSFQTLYSFGSSLGLSLTLVFMFSENQLFVASILYVALSVSINFYPDIDYFSHLLICCLVSSCFATVSGDSFSLSVRVAAICYVDIRSCKLSS